MSGPGSRLEKIGTIFSRVTGLLHSGALKESEKPIWYEVYAAFPPKQEPTYDRPLPEIQPPNIIYMEDFIRSKFYKVYGSPDVVDLTSSLSPSISQRFIEKYWELEKEGTHKKGEIFHAAAEALKSEGLKLVTLEEIEQEQRERARARLQEEAAAAEAAKQVSPPGGSDMEEEISEDTVSEDLGEYNHPDTPSR